VEGLDDRLLDDLVEWLRIPSVSNETPDPDGLLRAAERVRDRILCAGGSAELLGGLGNPLVVGELVAVRPDVPTVLVYGHYDVQSPGEPGAWTSPPFEPAIRDGRL
jgi:acetylornithine deacetylase/succinyl-diaminopimelate desuccinylase-like protein